MSEIEIVLDDCTLTLYRCLPKIRKLMGFKDLGHVTFKLESFAFCGICRDTNSAIAGYKYHHPKTDRYIRANSFQFNSDLRSSFLAMLVLNHLNSFTPFTPISVLTLIKGEQGENDLVELIGEEAWLYVKNTQLPEIDRVYDFLKGNNVTGIIDPRTTDIRYTNKEIKNMARQAMMDISTDNTIKRPTSRTPAT